MRRSPGKNFVGFKKPCIRVDNLTDNDWINEENDEEKPNIGHLILIKGGGVYTSHRASNTNLLS